MTLEKRAENTAGIQVVLKKLFFFSLAFSLFILIDRVAITLADLWLQGSFKSSWRWRSWRCRFGTVALQTGG